MLIIVCLTQKPVLSPGPGTVLTLDCSQAWAGQDSALGLDLHGPSKTFTKKTSWSTTGLDPILTHLKIVAPSTLPTYLVDLKVCIRNYVSKETIRLNLSCLPVCCTIFLKLVH